MPTFNTPSWKDLVAAVATDAKFAAPANETALASAESALQLSLPLELRELLLECDGFTADYSSDVVWSISEILRRNQEFREMNAFRELYMPFDNLLFFGDDGGGDQFAFSIQADGEIHKPDIYLWEHETDARSWFAGHLKQYFERRLSQ
jgi:hypothetical protein